MKVIEIERTHLHGTKKDHMVILEDDITNRAIQLKVKEWCKNRKDIGPCKSVMTWKEVTDSEILHHVIANEIKRKSDELHRIKNDHIRVVKELNKIFELRENNIKKK